MWHSSSSKHTQYPDLSNPISNKRNRDSFKAWPILRLVQIVHEMSLQHLLVPERKEMPSKRKEKKTNKWKKSKGHAEANLKKLPRLESPEPQIKPDYNSRNSVNAHAHNTINNWIKKIHGEKRQLSVTEELKIMNVERTRETELHHNDGCEQDPGW